MKKFIITEEERSRILGMHQSATSKQYLKEDGPSDAEWMAYVNRLNTNPPTAGSYLQTYTTVTPEDAKKGKYDMQFMVANAGGFKDNMPYYYQCIDSQGGEFKTGQVYDNNFELKPNIISNLDAGKTDYRKLFTKGCQATYQYKKLDPQIAQAQAANKSKSDADALALSNMKADSAKRDQERLDINKTIQPKLDDVNFLNPNQEDSVLDQQVKEIDNIIVRNGTNISVDNKNIIRQKLSTLLKYKPKYAGEPYYLTKDPF
jgi:hypothetical protein